MRLNRSKGHFSRSEKSKRSNLAVLLLFANFLKSRLILFFISCIEFLGDDIDQLQEMDFIELFKRSLSMSERSGVAHFPILILFSSNEALPKFIASCSFFGVKPILS